MLQLTFKLIPCCNDLYAGKSCSKTSTASSAVSPSTTLPVASLAASSSPAAPSRLALPRTLAAAYTLLVSVNWVTATAETNGDCRQLRPRTNTLVVATAAKTRSLHFDLGPEDSCLRHIDVRLSCSFAAGAQLVNGQFPFRVSTKLRLILPCVGYISCRSWWLVQLAVTRCNFSTDFEQHLSAMGRGIQPVYLGG